YVQFPAPEVLAQARLALELGKERTRIGNGCPYLRQEGRPISAKLERHPVDPGPKALEQLFLGRKAETRARRKQRNLHLRRIELIRRERREARIVKRGVDRVLPNVDAQWAQRVQAADATTQLGLAEQGHERCTWNGECSVAGRLLACATEPGADRAPRDRDQSEPELVIPHPILTQRPLPRPWLSR